MRQKTVDVSVIQQVAADFDLSSMRSEPGATSAGNLDAETLSLASAMSGAHSLLTKTNPTPARMQRGEPLKPEEALTYIQEVVRRLKKDQFFAN